MGSRHLAVGICLLLVSSGCIGLSPETSGPPSNSTAEPTPFGQHSRLTVYGSSAESLRFEPTRPMRATAEYLRVTPVSPTVTVHDAEPTSVRYTVRDAAERTPFSAETMERLGYENHTIRLTGASGYAAGRNITLVRRDATPSAVERVFTHEYVHVLQCTRPELRVPLSEKRWATSMDYRLTTRALIEGTAVLVTDRYVREHLPSEPRPSKQRQQRYRSAPPLLKIGAAPYAVGYRYLAARTTSPANVRAVYRGRPVSTEQLLHNESRESEPVARLGLDVSVRGDAWQRVYRYRLGELLLRTTLATELTVARARKAAAGWGTDAFYRFRNDTANGYVWVVRWDNRTAAGTFAEAAKSYAARRDRRTEWSFSVMRYNETITVLAFGNSFDRADIRLATTTTRDVGATPAAGHSGRWQFAHPPPSTTLNRSAIRDCTDEPRSSPRARRTARQ